MNQSIKFCTILNFLSQLSQSVHPLFLLSFITIRFLLYLLYFFQFQFQFQFHLKQLFISIYFPFAFSFHISFPHILKIVKTIKREKRQTNQLSCDFQSQSQYQHFHYYNNFS